MFTGAKPRLDNMPNFRSYGPPPYRVALVHGGPGAPGTMGPLAEVLSEKASVMELLQTAISLDGLQEELRTLLEEHAQLPVVLVGSSWGAVFSFMFAASYPSFVSKLILIGSGVFEEAYAEEIKATRMSRLAPDKRRRAETLLGLAEGAGPDEQSRYLEEPNDLFAEADAYDPLTLATGLIGVDARQHLAM